MDWIYLLILIGAGLIVISVLTSVLAFRFGAPLLLVFLSIGLLAGEDGLGLVFDDVDTAYFVGSLALAVILFDSGFVRPTGRLVVRPGASGHLLRCLGLGATRLPRRIGKLEETTNL